MEEGKSAPRKGITYYSKFVGKPEPTPEEVFNNFCKIIGRFSANGTLAYAHIYWNLNKGGRVNSFANKYALDVPFVQNVRLVQFDAKGQLKDVKGYYQMFETPIFACNESITQESLNQYQQRLRHAKIPETAVQTIAEYITHFFGGWEYVPNIEAVEPSKEAPQYEKPISPKIPQPEAPQEPAQEQEAGKEQESIAQQVSKTLEPYKLPALKKPSPTAVTPEQRKSAHDALAQGKRQAQQKEAFLHQLAQTQTHIAEKLKMYQTAYPADRIDKDFLQDILNSIIKENE